MEDIIKSIIDIDRGASKKLEDAEKEKLRIISDAKAAEEKLIRDAVESSEQEAHMLEENEKKNAEEKIKLLCEEKERKTAAMKKVFDDNSDKWCEDIFNAVVSSVKQ